MYTYDMLEKQPDGRKTLDILKESGITYRRYMIFGESKKKYIRLTLSEEDTFKLKLRGIKNLNDVLFPKD